MYMKSAKLYVIRYYDRNRCGWFDWVTTFNRSYAVSRLREIRSSGFDSPVSLITREIF